MSIIEDALRKARLLRNAIKNNDNALAPRSIQEQERGINVLIISNDPNISNIINNIQSFSPGDIIVSDNIVEGMISLFEKHPCEMNGCELRYTALMLNEFCCNCVSEASG